MNRALLAVQVAALMAVLSLPAPLFAQNRETERFQLLLRDYKQDPVRGVAQALAWPDAEDRFLILCRGTQRFAACTRSDFLTTAQLLLDVAIEVLDTDYNRAGRLMQAGASVLKALHAGYPMMTPLEAKFIPLWYSHASRVLLGQHFLDRSAQLLTEVFTWFPESAELYVTRGLIAEVPVGWLSSNLRGEKPTVIDENVTSLRFYVPPAGPNQGPTAAAANQYRRALEVDPTNVRAHLRLAWVHVRERDGRAVDDAQRALQHAVNDDERYLAHLLLAALAERNARYDDAIAAYSQARTFGTHYQAACTGLANAYAMSGNVAAAATAMECMSLKSTATQPDPWLVLRYGITEPAIVDWLHVEARRP